MVISADGDNKLVGLCGNMN